MSPVRRSICLISSGLTKGNLSLQPWRYLFEVAAGLSRQDYPVTVISDGGEHPPPETDLNGLSLVRLPGLRPALGHGYSLLHRTLSAIRPQVILWNAGLTSLIYQNFRLCPDSLNIGIFTSPIYPLAELARLGPVKLIRHRSLTAVPLLGSLLPRWYVRNRLKHSGLDWMVTQTYTTRDQLKQVGFSSGKIEIIPPGVDETWQPLPPAERTLARGELGFSPQDIVVVYFGSPAPLRGLPVLVRAVELARRNDPSLKLLVLSRRRPAELCSQDGYLSELSNPQSGRSWIRLLDGYMDKTSLVRAVAAADIAALPFELVPSDAPLSLLEAQSLGLPLVTTRVACLPELASQGMRYLAAPTDPQSLAGALLRAVQDLHSAESASGFVPPALIEETPPRSWEQVGEEWVYLLEKM
jgi:glycosyltransferase involved in cell wall biosynthesis